MADRLVCISEYMRSAALEDSDLSPEKVISIPIQLFDRLAATGPEIINAALKKHVGEQQLSALSC